MQTKTTSKILDPRSSDDELEQLARQMIEGMSLEDARALCLALYELYNDLTKPIYH